VGGLGIVESNSAEHQDMSLYLMRARKRGVEDTFPARANDLLNDMKTDISKFYRRLSWSGNGGDQHVGAPLLAKIDVDKFVDAFLALHPSSQHIVMMALKGRYGSGQLQYDLKDERAWIESVRDVLTKRLAKLSRISQYRIQKQIELYLSAAV
jgi:hypothetical protein